MRVVLELTVVALAACGAQPRPAPAAFDAKHLAAELDAVMADMASAAARWEADCPRLVDELGRIEDRARRPVEEARVAQKDRERANQLTTAARAYDQKALGRSTTIAVALAGCWRAHIELRDRVQRVVDSLPSL